jgi:hypothetical protein
MSYGYQLNIFRAKSNQYGPDWRGIVACRSHNELQIAADDAKEVLAGRYSPAGQTLHCPNGATLLFRVVTNRMEAARAFSGRNFTQIAWLHAPEDQEIRVMARAQLRSRVVPDDDLRYEYCTVL